ncbi:MAG: SIS domain-containing protein [candidate division Zixibacteria bacterium]
MSIDNIKKALKESADLKLLVAEKLSEKINQAAITLSSALAKGSKAMFCGNGGSAADSQHLATELVVRLTAERERRALPAITLTTNSSILTACANDFGFEHIFSRQVEALGNSGDILFAISTSGNSNNVIRAVETAKEKGVYTIGMLGGDGGRLGSLVDSPLIVPSNDTQRIQEAHIAIGHIIIETTERELFGS